MNQDVFSIRTANSSGRRRPEQRRAIDHLNMTRVVRDIVYDVLQGAFSDSVLHAEIGASQGCIGYYIDTVFGDGHQEHGATAPEPFLRSIAEFGGETEVDPVGLAVCAAALRRLTDDPDAHRIADRIVRSTRATVQDGPWPAWLDLPPVVAIGAWAARGVDGRLASLASEWIDERGERHAFATIGYDPVQPGTAPSSLIVGTSAAEIIAEFEAPIDEHDEPYRYEQVSLDEARELLTASIDDVALLTGRLLPRDLPLTQLAFLERRRDLL